MTVYWTNKEMAKAGVVGAYQAWPDTWMTDRPNERAVLTARMQADGWEQTDRETYRRFSRTAYARARRAEWARQGRAWRR